MSSLFLTRIALLPMFDHPFSAAQIAGYFAFVLGVVCFLQRDDRRFKQVMIAQALSYAIHFAMLGATSSMASALIALLRTTLSLYSSSLRLALAIVALNLAIGPWLVHVWTDWLPLIATCIGTLALFLFQGIAMRLVLLTSTMLWLINTILVGSIGGTALEVMIAIANIVTIWRLWRKRPPKTAERVGA
ncbi:MAG: YgjV family protein [Pseudomonadota bacterium]|nr:YgjV family protein [Pseudomonadota bacterium]